MPEPRLRLFICNANIGETLFFCRWGKKFIFFMLLWFLCSCCCNEFFFLIVCLYYSSTVYTIGEEYPDFCKRLEISQKYSFYYLYIPIFALRYGIQSLKGQGNKTILCHSVWLQLSLRPAMTTSLRELYTQSLSGLKLVLLKVTLAWSVPLRSDCCLKCLGLFAFWRVVLSCSCVQALWDCGIIPTPPFSGSVRVNLVVLRGKREWKRED